MNKKRLVIGLFLGGLSCASMAQVPATYAVQSTRTYTLAEVNSLARTINSTNVREQVICSSVDNSNPTTNTRRMFTMNSSGNIFTNVNVYNKDQSSSSSPAIVTKVAGQNPGGTTSPIYSATMTGMTPLASSSSGNTRTFNYTVDGRVKSVVATSAGFFFTYGGANYLKGC